MPLKLSDITDVHQDIMQYYALFDNINLRLIACLYNGKLSTGSFSYKNLVNISNMSASY